MAASYMTLHVFISIYVAAGPRRVGSYEISFISLINLEGWGESVIYHKFDNQKSQAFKGIVPLRAGVKATCL